MLIHLAQFNFPSPRKLLTFHGPHIPPMDGRRRGQQLLVTLGANHLRRRLPNQAVQHRGAAQVRIDGHTVRILVDDTVVRPVARRPRRRGIVLIAVVVLVAIPMAGRGVMLAGAGRTDVEEPQQEQE